MDWDSLKRWSLLDLALLKEVAWMLSHFILYLFIETNESCLKLRHWRVANRGDATHFGEICIMQIKFF